MDGCGLHPIALCYRCSPFIAGCVFATGFTGFCSQQKCTGAYFSSHMNIYAAVAFAVCKFYSISNKVNEL